MSTPREGLIYILLDFAQRFLIEALRQYEPFIANQLRCDEMCTREWDKIKSAPRSLDLQQMVAQPVTLNGFFMKPFQRLTKYPLMLSELRKQTDDEDQPALRLATSRSSFHMPTQQHQPPNPSFVAPIPQHHPVPPPVTHLRLDTTADYGMDLRAYPMSATTTASMPDFASPSIFTTRPPSEPRESE
ncbi:hypothetical protein Egran_03453 [Elaphomyces granulatus]|uniref:DH domain-containing protein n=1 Tax=Elaphomyces granulatus TaxID=519963 RepID=A0A232LXI0_9EURO|nr:hypothetical protein Egran_03453 [Elaphomyces granulatus]